MQLQWRSKAAEGLVLYLHTEIILLPPKTVDNGCTSLLLCRIGYNAVVPTG